MTHPMSYYTYETIKVHITWNGKVQPVGMFKSAESANTFINRHLILSSNELPNYKIVTPDAILDPVYDPEPQYNPFATDKTSNIQ